MTDAEKEYIEAEFARVLATPVFSRVAVLNKLKAENPAVWDAVVQKLHALSVANAAGGGSES